MSDFDDLLERLLLEPHFKAELAAHPDRALAGYRLDAEERAVLMSQVSGDIGPGGRVEERISKASMGGLLSALHEVTTQAVPMPVEQAQTVPVSTAGGEMAAHLSSPVEARGLATVHPIGVAHLTDHQQVHTGPPVHTGDSQSPHTDELKQRHVEEFKHKQTEELKQHKQSAELKHAKSAGEFKRPDIFQVGDVQQSGATPTDPTTAPGMLRPDLQHVSDQQLQSDEQHKHLDELKHKQAEELKQTKQTEEVKQTKQTEELKQPPSGLETKQAPSGLDMKQPPSGLETKQAPTGETQAASG